jgi:hypothetical protein
VASAQIIDINGTRPCWTSSRHGALLNLIASGRHFPRAQQSTVPSGRDRGTEAALHQGKGVNSIS